MVHKVVYEQSARDDLRSTFWWIVERADHESAHAYVQRIRDRCDRLGTFPDQGTLRDDVLPGLRTVAFERTAIIAYLSDQKAVRVLRVLRKGRDFEQAFD
ncbi:MAG TPA: type II toxin-antitoxin system RelE/ParE family toxin [Sphingomicrobium sp.]|nr:type II toxin-antitoxin system RelE/ParE family toxin [Sphingomicrobium sp.]